MVEVNQPADGDTCETFIQWKGSDICISVDCACGTSSHYDGDFAYGLKCGRCGAVWTLPVNLTLTRGIPPSGIVREMTAEHTDD